LDLEWISVSERISLTCRILEVVFMVRAIATKDCFVL
jgi:hypothetical protein